MRSARERRERRRERIREAVEARFEPELSAITLEVMAENPTASDGQITQLVEGEVAERYRSSPFLALLLKLLPELLPLILELLKQED
jgi:hypothetical protein